jgi:hypothetical protein
MNLKERIRVDKKRLARFRFESLQAIRIKVSDKPELEDSFRKDFKATLEAEGIKVDEAFLKGVEKEWREQISQDIRAKVAAAPDKYPMMSKVIEGKPIRVHVTVDEASHRVKTKEVK